MRRVPLQRERLRKMLSDLPKDADKKLRAVFEKQGPLTLEMFELAAKLYRLPKPVFSNFDLTVVVKKQADGSIV